MKDWSLGKYLSEGTVIYSIHPIIGHDICHYILGVILMF